MQIINPENPTVVLGGEEYVSRKMTDNGKYYVDQIQDLNIQTNQLKAKSHQIEVARVGFVSLLKAEIEALGKNFCWRSRRRWQRRSPRRRTQPNLEELAFPLATRRRLGK